MLGDPRRIAYSLVARTHPSIQSPRCDNPTGHRQPDAHNPVSCIAVPALDPSPVDTGLDTTTSPNRTTPPNNRIHR